jgi:hypothetical protein
MTNPLGVMEKHQTRIGIMASPGAPHYGEGFYASCTCGWRAEQAHGRPESASDFDPARVAARRDGHQHLLDMIAANDHEPSIERIEHEARAMINRYSMAGVGNPVATYLDEDEDDTPWLRMDAVDFLIARVPGADAYDEAHGDPEGHEAYDRAPARATIDDELSKAWHRTYRTRG